MKQMIVCEGNLVEARYGGDTLDTSVLGCDTGWIILPAPPSDLSWLQSAFTFDLVLFSELMGFCVLLFIIGHSAGHVARNLSRV